MRRWISILLAAVMAFGGSYAVISMLFITQRWIGWMVISAGVIAGVGFYLLVEELQGSAGRGK